MSVAARSTDQYNLNLQVHLAAISLGSNPPHRRHQTLKQPHQVVPSIAAALARLCQAAPAVASVVLAVVLSPAQP